MSNKQFLSEIFIFNNLDDKELDYVENVISILHFPAKTYILVEEDETDSVFIIKKGTVEVTLTNEAGKELILAFLEEGEVFGELAAFDGHPRSANVRAQENCVVLCISKVDFIDLIWKHSKIAIALLQELSTRIRHLDQQIMSLSLFDSKHRIANSIYQIAERKGKIFDGEVVIERSPTHKEIANMTGNSRETVTRILKSFKDQGFLYTKGRKMVIPDFESFKRLTLDNSG